MLKAGQWSGRTQWLSKLKKHPGYSYLYPGIERHVKKVLVFYQCSRFIFYELFFSTLSDQASLWNQVSKVSISLKSSQRRHDTPSPFSVSDLLTTQKNTHTHTHLYTQPYAPNSCARTLRLLFNTEQLQQTPSRQKGNVSPVPSCCPPQPLKT